MWFMINEFVIVVCIIWKVRNYLICVVNSVLMVVNMNKVIDVRIMGC